MTEPDDNPPRTIDLNADLGEGAAHDAELMPLITSVNIACGGHAGDQDTISRTLELAVRHGVAVGAHPGYEDRPGFGRQELTLPPGEVRGLVLRQVERLRRAAEGMGARVTHVKPHGALYNQAARGGGIAAELIDAVLSLDLALPLVVLSGSRLAHQARNAGLRVIEEAFVDRAYQPDGTLTPRQRADALIDSDKAAVRQALALVLRGQVTTPTGRIVYVRADTICLHGDGPHAVAFAQRLRYALEARRVRILPVKA
jgi:UPF0271 protein